MQHEKTIANRLLRVASELADLAKSMLADEVDADFPQSAVKTMEAGKCLNCDRKPDEIKVIKRGLCQACYQRTQRKLLANPKKEAELIAAGLLAPRNFNPAATDDAIDRIFKQQADESDRSKSRTKGTKKRE